MDNDEKRISNLLQLINVSERRIILEKSNIDKYKSELKQLKNIKNKEIFKKFAKTLLKINNSTKSITKSTTKPTTKSTTTKTKTAKTKSTTTKTKTTAKKGRKKTVTVVIMKKALKTHNIKFSSKMKKNELESLIKKHCLVRYCESQIKN